MSEITVPEGWSISKIGSTCYILDSKRIPLNAQERALRPGIYPYYGANGVQGYIDDFIFEGKHVLLAEDGGYFEEWDSRPISYLVNGKFWVNNHAHILQAKEEHDTKFVHYSLVHKNILKHINGGTRSKLNQSDMREIEYLSPPLPEQQKIAAILTSVDTVIEKTHAQINKLKHLKTAMMQELLTQGIGHTEFKDTPVGRIPKAWEVVQLKEVFTLNYGKSPKEIIAENGANIVWGTGGATAKTNSFLYEGESIVLGRKGTIDQPRYITGKFWVIDTAYYSSNHGENNVSFLWYVLQMKNLRALNEASGVPSLSRDTLYAEWIALPSPEEQQEIAKILSSVERKLTATNKKIESLKNTKKALMQDLLSGKVRVPSTFSVE